MTDEIDNANERTQTITEQSIAAARMGPVHLPGDPECKQCGNENDRARDGYGVCSVCVEGAR